MPILFCTTLCSEHKVVQNKIGIKYTAGNENKVWLFLHFALENWKKLQMGGHPLKDCFVEHGCNILTLQPEQSGRVSLIPNWTPPLERHFLSDKR